jgi:hypothetical protein
MVSVGQLIAAIIASVFGSGGFWAFITYKVQRKDAKDSAEAQMLKGLGHDRICHLGSVYVKQGYITKDDYENLHDYLFIPYKKLGGNGTAEKIMSEVEKLPLREKEEVHHG